MRSVARRSRIRRHFALTLLGLARKTHERRPLNKHDVRRNVFSFELLEQRQLLATILWDGGPTGTGTSFSDSANWVGDVKPGPNDDAVIDSVGASIQFTNSEIIKSLSSVRTIELTSGVFEVATTLDAQANFVLSGLGTLKGATVQTSPGVSLIASGGTLNGITLNGNMRVVTPASTLTVRNGLTVNGSVSLGNPSSNEKGSLYFQGAQTLGGTGNVVFEGNLANAIEVTDSEPLTIGANITVRGASGFVGRATSGYGGTNSIVVNQGVIRSDLGGTITFMGGRLQGTGSVTANAGSTIAIKMPVRNDGNPLNLNGAGQFVINTTVQNTNLNIAVGTQVLVSNSTFDAVTVNGSLSVYDGDGTLRVENGLTLNGTINLGGMDPTPQSGAMEFVGTQTIGGTGNVVFASNVVHNRISQEVWGGTLTVGGGITIRGNTGTVGRNFFTAAINNLGTIQADVAGGTITAFSDTGSNSGTLRAVNGGILSITGFRWSNTGILEAGVSSTIISNATYSNSGNVMTLTGSGQFSFNSTITGGTISIVSPAQVRMGGTLVGVTINGNLSFVQDEIFGQVTTVTNGLTLNGLATLGDSTNRPGVLIFDGTQSLSGQGSLVFVGTSVQNGIVTTADLNVAPTITIRGTTGYLGRNPNGYGSSGGTIINKGAILWNSGADIRIGSKVINEGLIRIDSSSEMRIGGTLEGGTILASAGSRINGGTFRRVTIDGNVRFASSEFFATIQNGLTINGTATLGDGPNASLYGMLYLVGAQTLGGSGSIIFEGTNSMNAIVQTTDNAALTIGQGITIRGQQGFIGRTPNGYGNQPVVVNQGTIQSDVPGGNITILAPSFQSNGNLKSIVGSTLTINARIHNTGNTISFNGDGDFVFASQSFGAYIQGGTVNIAPETRINLVQGTLDGVAVSGNIGIHGQVSVTNGLVINGTLSVGDINTPSQYGVAQFVGSQTLGGTGNVVFANNHNGNTLSMEPSGAVLTIGPGVSVRGRAGALGRNPAIGYGVDDAIVINQGTMEWTNGSTFSIPRQFSNQGVLKNFSGALVTFRGGSTYGTNSYMATSPGSTFSFAGDIVGSTTASGSFQNAGEIEISGGSLAAPRLMEVMSINRGVGRWQSNSNFAFNSIRIADSSNVRLIDDHRNSPGTVSEALYVGTLSVAAGSQLDLNGLNVYARSFTNSGTIVGGTVSQIPDSGDLAFASPTPGSIGIVGEVDEWLFYGRSAQHVSIQVNPSNSGLNVPVPPLLNRAQLTLFDPAGNVIASATNASNGGSFSLSDFTLTANGTYRIQVRAANGFEANTGNYNISIYDVTDDFVETTLGKPNAGAIEYPFGIDRWKFSAAQAQQIRFDLTASSSPDIQFTLTGPGGFTAFADLSTSSGLISLPSTGAYELRANGIGVAVGQYSFQLLETAQTTLVLGQQLSRTNSGSNSGMLFRVNVPNSGPLRLQLDDSVNTNRNELYIKYGLPPTRTNFDQRSETQNSADHSVLVPNANQGDWFVLVHGTYVPSPSTFTILAEGNSVFLSSLTPDRAGSNSNAEVSIKGAGFKTDSTVQLVGSSNNIVATSSSVQVDSYSTLSATIPLAGVQPGVYSTRVVQPGGFISDTLPASFTVLPSGESRLETRLVMPREIGRHVNATVFVEYANTGSVAMAAPLIRLQSADTDGSDRPMLTLDQSIVSRGFWSSEASSLPDGFSNTVQIIANGSTPGLLGPGERISVPVYYIGLQQPWNFSDNQIEMELRIFESTNTELVPWSTLRDDLRPESISADAWNVIFGNLTSNIGPAWGDFVRMLSENALFLNRLGHRVIDVGSLWSYEVQQAIGFSPVRTLASSVDAAITSRGADLTFGRSWSLALDQRFATSSFGRGWSTPWQTRLAVDPDGNVDILGSGGSRRRFIPDSRFLTATLSNPGRGNAYFAFPGDSGILNRVGNGTYELREQDGSTTRFDAQGRLDYTQDVNGNRVTAGYDAASRLTSLTHSSGTSITIAYNAAGLIESLTDSAGRVSMFTYDSTNQYLISSTGSDGVLTTYTYNTTANSPRQHSLMSVTTGGVVQQFEFDPQGRLSATATKLSPTSESSRIAFNYDTAGRVIITDSGGGTTNLFYDDRGLLTKVTDPFGNVTNTEYGDDLRISKIVDPLGQTQSFTWCSCGSLSSSIDQLGNKTSFEHEFVGPNNTIRRMTSFTDANGNTTRYTYDIKGNLTSTIYPNGTIERTSLYDSLGDPLTFINRRGQVMNYMYNAVGQVTRQTFNDGSFIDLAYDSRGNLSTVTEPGNKVTTYTYDSSDRLTRVLYPQGRYLDFTYDTAGRRATMTDQLGYVLRYTYDAAGRLFRLHDTSNTLIVEYLYDAAGRLSRKNNGNNTYTEYLYDLAGQLLSIHNRAPNGSINSSFVYTYDALGRRTSMVTIDGTWVYGYDPTGQLTSAIFSPVVGSPIPAQDLRYVYDPLGNRIRTIENGVTTEYTTNNLNQYTQVGADTLIYDADGNLISRSGPGGNATYSYDQQSRLVRVVTADGVWQYEYDAFGNRNALLRHGARKDLVRDPTGLSMVIAEYGADNIVRNHFGLGLSNRNDNGTKLYYDFDATGNTSNLTSMQGMVVGNATYLPFGGRIGQGNSQDNPFGFSGLTGVQTDTDDFAILGFRFISINLGRFIVADPVRIVTQSYYSFAFNNPISFVDPNGLAPVLACDHANPFGLQPNLSQPQYYWEPARPTTDKHPGIEQLEKAAALGSLAAWSLIVGTITDKGIVAIGFGTEGAAFVGGLVNPLWGPATGWWDLAGGVARELIIKFGPTPGDELRGAWSCAKLGECVVLSIPNGAQGDEKLSIAATAIDPNELLGPSGFGPSNFMSIGSVLPYRINFENYGPGSVEHDGTPAPASRWATAPAQQVEITNIIPTQIDIDTVALTGFGFGDFKLPIDAISQYHEQTVSMTFNNKLFDVWFTAALDRNTRTLRILLQSIDPTTDLPPEVLIGFLPPEDGTGRGMGYITYTARPMPGLTSGTEIRNIAAISFDGQPPIYTDQIDPLDPSLGNDPNRQARVTIDAILPTSNMTTLPSISNSPSIPLTWSGSDDANGSGIAGYDLFVSANNNPYTAFQTNTTDTSAVFAGELGNTYRFYSIAIDNTGQRQAIPSVAHATTRVPGPPTQVSLSQNSISENSAPNSIVGAITSADPDPDETYSYSLVSGIGSVDNGQFVILDGNLVSNLSIDFESKSSYSVRLQVQDSRGFTFAAPVAIHVIDVNEAPSVQLNNVINNLAENANSAGPVRVADVSIIDDALGAETVTLTGPDAAKFEVVGNSLLVKSGVTLDYEDQFVYSLILQIDDPTVGGTPDSSVNYVLTLTDVNEPVVFTRDRSEVYGALGSTLTNTGTWSDPENSVAGVNLSASLGTVTKNSSGSWAWSYSPTALVNDQLVTIFANDGTTSSISFNINVVAALSVSFGGIASPRTTSVSSLGFSFNRPVANLSHANLQLSRSSNSVNLTSATLSTSDGGTTWALTLPANLTYSGGDYQLALINVIDAFGTPLMGNSVINWRRNAFVELNDADAVRMFYNGSSFDGNGIGIDSIDDNARSTNKRALIPGTGIASFANISSYSRGINGIMIDVDGLPGSVTANDFQFRVGNDDNISSWVAPSQSPTNILVRSGQGINASSRVMITWADNVIAKTWLQLTILPNSNTELGTSTTFYFGHWTGDTGTGNSALGNIVNAIDQALVRNNFTDSSTTALVTNNFDFNRDGRVNAVDQALARLNFTDSSNFLRFINPPSSFSRSGSVAGSLSASREKEEHLSAVFANLYDVDEWITNVKKKQNNSKVGN